MPAAMTAPHGVFIGGRNVAQRFKKSQEIWGRLRVGCRPWKRSRGRFTPRRCSPGWPSATSLSGAASVSPARSRTSISWATPRSSAPTCSPCSWRPSASTSCWPPGSSRFPCGPFTGWRETLGGARLGAGVVLLGFALGATTVTVGILAPVRQALRGPAIAVDGGAPTLANLVGLSPWVVIAVLGLVVVVFLWRGGGEPEHGKWPWPATGIAVGVLIALGWWTSSFGDAPAGITFASNTGQALTYPLVGYPNRVNWSMVLLVGVPIGAFPGARPVGEYLRQTH